MGHYLINPSWKCQLSCHYCLIPHIKINRKAKEHTWQEWADGIIKNAEPHSVIDVAGGEPLLFPGLGYFLQAIGEAGHLWAITTNAIDDEGVAELVRIRPTNCAQVNISDHPENQDKDENIEKLRSAFRVSVNRVDIPGDWHRREVNHLIPYQSWREGTELDGIKRICNSGLHHWVADPAGDVFRCNPEMACGKKPIGNLFSEPFQSPPPVICVDGCSTCQTSYPGAWMVDMKEVQGEDVYIETIARNK